MRLEEYSENKSTYFTALNELKWFPFFDFFGTEVSSIDSGDYGGFILWFIPTIQGAYFAGGIIFINSLSGTEGGRK